MCLYLIYLSHNYYTHTSLYTGTGTPKHANRMAGSLAHACTYAITITYQMAFKRSKFAVLVNL